MSSTVRTLTKLEFKRRDNDSIELVFLRAGEVQELSSGTTARLGIKADADYDSEFLALTTLTQSGTGEATVYSGELNLNTTAISTAFAAEPVTFAAMLEVEWTTGSVISSSQTLAVTIFNDVIRGDEGAAIALPVFYLQDSEELKATQAEAQAGVENTHYMTALRTAQAIAALTSDVGVSSWNDLTDKPSTFPPEAHAHPLSDLSTSGAVAGQVAAYDGTSWVPQDVNAGVTSYNDLTDVPSEFLPSEHVHHAGHINMGTLDIGRIPIGTTSTTVAIGNHTHVGQYMPVSGGITSISVQAVLPSEPSPSVLYILTS